MRCEGMRFDSISTNSKVGDIIFYISSIPRGLYVYSIVYVN